MQKQSCSEIIFSEEIEEILKLLLHDAIDRFKKQFDCTFKFNEKGSLVLTTNQVEKRDKIKQSLDYFAKKYYFGVVYSGLKYENFKKIFNENTHLYLMQNNPKIRCYHSQEFTRDTKSLIINNKSFFEHNDNASKRYNLFFGHTDDVYAFIQETYLKQTIKKVKEIIESGGDCCRMIAPPQQKRQSIPPKIDDKLEKYSFTSSSSSSSSSKKPIVQASDLQQEEKDGKQKDLMINIGQQNQKLDNIISNNSKFQDPSDAHSNLPISDASFQQKAILADLQEESEAEYAKPQQIQVQGLLAEQAQADKTFKGSLKLKTKHLLWLCFTELLQDLLSGDQGIVQHSVQGIAENTLSLSIEGGVRTKHAVQDLEYKLQQYCFKIIATNRLKKEDQALQSSQALAILSREKRGYLLYLPKHIIQERILPQVQSLSKQMYDLLNEYLESKQRRRRSFSYLLALREQFEEVKKNLYQAALRLNNKSIQKLLFLKELIFEKQISAERQNKLDDELDRIETEHKNIIIEYKFIRNSTHVEIYSKSKDIVDHQISEIAQIIEASISIFFREALLIELSAQQVQLFRTLGGAKNWLKLLNEEFRAAQVQLVTDLCSQQFDVSWAQQSQFEKCRYLTHQKRIVLENGGMTRNFIIVTAENEQLLKTVEERTLALLPSTQKFEQRLCIAVLQKQTNNNNNKNLHEHSAFLPLIRQLGEKALEEVRILQSTYSFAIEKDVFVDESQSVCIKFHCVSAEAENIISKMQDSLRIIEDLYLIAQISINFERLQQFLIDQPEFAEVQIWKETNETAILMGKRDIVTRLARNFQTQKFVFKYETEFEFVQAKHCRELLLQKFAQREDLKHVQIRAEQQNQCLLYELHGDIEEARFKQMYDKIWKKVTLKNVPHFRESLDRRHLRYLLTYKKQIAAEIMQKFTVRLGLEAYELENLEAEDPNPPDAIENLQQKQLLIKRSSMLNSLLGRILVRRVKVATDVKEKKEQKLQHYLMINIVTDVRDVSDSIQKDAQQFCKANLSNTLLQIKQAFSQHNYQSIWFNSTGLENICPDQDYAKYFLYMLLVRHRILMDAHVAEVQILIPKTQIEHWQKALQSFILQNGKFRPLQVWSHESKYIYDVQRYRKFSDLEQAQLETAYYSVRKHCHFKYEINDQQNFTHIFDLSDLNKPICTEIDSNAQLAVIKQQSNPVDHNIYYCLMNMTTVCQNCAKYVILGEEADDSEEDYDEDYDEDGEDYDDDDDEEEEDYKKPPKQNQALFGCNKSMRLCLMKQPVLMKLDAPSSFYIHKHLGKKDVYACIRDLHIDFKKMTVIIMPDQIEVGVECEKQNLIELVEVNQAKEKTELQLQFGSKLYDLMLYAPTKEYEDKLPAAHAYLNEYFKSQHCSERLNVPKAVSIGDAKVVSLLRHHDLSFVVEGSEGSNHCYEVEGFRESIAAFRNQLESYVERVVAQKQLKISTSVNRVQLFSAADQQSLAPQLYYDIDDGQFFPKSWALQEYQPDKYLQFIDLDRNCRPFKMIENQIQENAKLHGQNIKIIAIKHVQNQDLYQLFQDSKRALSRLGKSTLETQLYFGAQSNFDVRTLLEERQISFNVLRTAQKRSHGNAIYFSPDFFTTLVHAQFPKKDNSSYVLVCRVLLGQVLENATENNCRNEPEFSDQRLNLRYDSISFHERVTYLRKKIESKGYAIFASNRAYAEYIVHIDSAEAVKKNKKIEKSKK